MTSIPAYLEPLTPLELHHLWEKAHKAGWVEKPTPGHLPDPTDLPFPVNHTDLVLLLANDPTPPAHIIMEKLLAKPIYMCARGETSAVLLDAQNRVIITPKGSYRNTPEKLYRDIEQTFNKIKTVSKFKKTKKLDNRIVTEVAPNPKRPGSQAHAHYEQYKKGRTVSWHYDQTDVTPADVRWDSSKGFITLVTPSQNH